MAKRVELALDRVEEIIKSLHQLHGRGVSLVDIFKVAFPPPPGTPEKNLHGMGGYGAVRVRVERLVAQGKVARDGVEWKRYLYKPVGPTLPRLTDEPLPEKIHKAVPSKALARLKDELMETMWELMADIKALQAVLEPQKKKWWQIWK